MDVGPHSTISAIKKSIFIMIMDADDSIYLITLYLISDFGVITTLKNITSSGVDVRIFTYAHVFCRVKVLVVDEKIATIGMTNIDIRIFYLNFEVNVMLYQPQSIASLLNDFNRDFSRSTEIIYSEWQTRPLEVRTLQSLAQLFSALM